MSTQFYDNQVATVDYQILFTKRDKEALLEHGTITVATAMTGSGFASWQIARFMETLNRGATAPNINAGIEKPKDWTDDEAIELAVKVFPWNNFPNRPPDAPILRVIGLKPENLKYLQVDHQIVSAFDRKPPTDQVAALRDIATAIKNRS